MKCKNCGKIKGEHYPAWLYSCKPKGIEKFEAENQNPSGFCLKDKILTTGHPLANMMFEDVKEFIRIIEDDILTPLVFHEIYEKQARRSGWETHKDCKLKPFDELPQTNQETMIYTLNEIIERIKKTTGDLE